MQLKVSTDYAIRIVLHLAVKGGAATSSEISGQMGVPPVGDRHAGQAAAKGGPAHHPAGRGRRLRPLPQAGGHLPPRDRQPDGGHHPHQSLPGGGRLLLPQWCADLPRP